jgi:hypothetical protein
MDTDVPDAPLKGGTTPFTSRVKHERDAGCLESVLISESQWFNRGSRFIGRNPNPGSSG